MEKLSSLLSLHGDFAWVSAVRTSSAPASWTMRQFFGVKNRGVHWIYHLNPGWQWQFLRFRLLLGGGVDLRYPQFLECFSMFFQRFFRNSLIFGSYRSLLCSVSCFENSSLNMAEMFNSSNIFVFCTDKLLRYDHDIFPVGN